ncbi:uroporphyrinogen decarboxylase family protein [Clostridium sp.]|uniref:uroporphyrinogen decarboxylase family protein n=1 Tax=Clostridium sp. TaxID=1506 RepID=UPI0032178F39
MPFVCNDYNHRTLIPYILEELNISNEKDLHYNKENIIKIALKTKESLTDSWIKLPFCNTLEGEVLGAKVLLTIDGAKIKEPCFKNINDIPTNTNMYSDRLNTMLEVLDSLKDENVIYNLEGPFTILDCLLDTTTIFKAIRQQEKDFFMLLTFVEEFIVNYGTLAYKHGAKILSFGDPLGTKDIIGPRLFKSVYINSFKRIISGLIHNCPKATIHICGKLSQDLVDTNIVKISDYRFPKDISYGEALVNYTKLSSKESIVGLMCVNRTNKNYNTIHRIKFIYS